MPVEFHIADNRLFAAVGGKTVAEMTSEPSACPVVAPVSDGVYRVTWHAPEPVDRMSVRMTVRFTPKHTMIPAILYDGNPFGHDHEYKGYAMDGAPYVIAYHRSAVPSATVSWSDEYSAALYGGVDTACNLIPGENGVAHCVQWPEEETPKALCGHGWGPAYHGRIEPRRAFTVTLCLGGAGGEALRRMLDQAWREGMAVDRRPARRAREVRALSIEYAKTLYTREANGFCGFNIGLTLSRDGKAWIKRAHNPYEIGWCGQNASLAIQRGNRAR